MVIEQGKYGHSVNPLAETLGGQVEANWKNLYYRPQMPSDSLLSFLVGWKTSTLNIPNDLPEGRKAVSSEREDRVMYGFQET